MNRSAHQVGSPEYKRAQDALNRRLSTFVDSLPIMRRLAAFERRQLEHCGVQKDPTSEGRLQPELAPIVYLPALIPETSGRFILRWRCRECRQTFKTYATGSNHLTRRHS